MTIRNILITPITILSLLISCNSGIYNVNVQDSKEEIEKSPSISSWSNEFVMLPDGEGWSYYNDHEKFISKYFSVMYEKGHIVATTLIRVHCSDSIVGKIEVSNDMIYLKSDVLMRNGQPCPEYHKFEFVINNPENKKYKVISVK